MFRLLDASMELNTWAGALNMFALWAVSAGVAGLIFAFCSRQPRPRLISGAGLDSTQPPTNRVEVTEATALVPTNWFIRQSQIAAGFAECSTRGTKEGLS